MNLSIERVLRFVVVAEQLSFTRAAQQLNIDQPWLSRQIMQLEEQLGFALFDRSSLRITLTTEGAEFLERAKAVVEATHQLRNKAEEINRRIQAELRVGVTHAAIPLKVHETLLARFSAICPDVHLDLSACEQPSQLMSRVESGELDFGIVIALPKWLELPSCILDTVKLSVAIPMEDPLAQRESISTADLENRRFATGEHAEGHESMWSWLAAAGVVSVPVLGGRRFIFEVAEKERLLVFCYNDTERLPANYVSRRLTNGGPEVVVALVRKHGAISQVAERLWRLGGNCSQQLVGATAA
jgi:DNA-binding transcriptional LysR family regulator